MRKLLWTLSCAALAALALAPAARAGIISGPRMIEPPAVLGPDPIGSESFYAFYEQQNHVLAEAVRVDGGWIDVGTRVSSHYLIYDPAARTRNSITVTFDAPILGVMSTGRRLRASDWIGADEVDYRSFRHRRFEWRDAYRISADGHSVTLRMRANSPGDYFRIVTAGRTLTPPPPPVDDPPDPPDPPAVPEPGAALLFGAGALAVRAVARQRGR
jgi:hypothetical protein